MYPILNVNVAVALSLSEIGSQLALVSCFHPSFMTLRPRKQISPAKNEEYQKHFQKYEKKTLYKM